VVSGINGGEDGVADGVQGLHLTLGESEVFRLVQVENRVWLLQFLIFGSKQELPEEAKGKRHQLPDQQHRLPDQRHQLLQVFHKSHLRIHTRQTNKQKQNKKQKTKTEGEPCLAMGRIHRIYYSYDVDSK